MCVGLQSSALERLHASSRFSSTRHLIVANAIAAEPILRCVAPARTFKWLGGGHSWSQIKPLPTIRGLDVVDELELIRALRCEHNL
jgi:hypothetical protein